MHIYCIVRCLTWRIVMTKIDVLDEVIEILIKKVIKDEKKLKKQIVRGEIEDGLYSSPCNRE